MEAAQRAGAQHARSRERSWRAAQPIQGAQPRAGHSTPPAMRPSLTSLVVTPTLFFAKYICSQVRSIFCEDKQSLVGVIHFLNLKHIFMGGYSIIRINILYFPWSLWKKNVIFDFQGEPGEKGGIGSIGPRVWMFMISVWSCVFVSTLAVPHHLFLLSMWMNRFRISSVWENRDGAYLNKWLHRYWMLTWEISQVQFSYPYDHPVTLFFQEGSWE